MVGITSAAGIVALLDEPEAELKRYALEKLNEIVDDFWAEISESVQQLEILSEDESFPHHQLAALVVSKVYYHLGELQQSLSFALAAGTEFDVNSKTLYVTIILEQAVDLYTQNQQSGAASDPKLAATVNRMFARCLEAGSFKQVLGIALETRRLDMLERAIVQSSEPRRLLLHTVGAAMTLVSHLAFRTQVLELVLTLFEKLAINDDTSLCQCAVLLNRVDVVLSVLGRLLAENQAPMAMQIAFDLSDRAPQAFILATQAALKAQAEDGSLDATLVQRMDKVLSGEMTSFLFLDFLSRNNHADPLMLNATKDANPRNPVCHSATVLSNAMMYAGTTSDAFLRANREWLSRATNWSKFSAVAGLGVIHKGHVTQAHTLLAPYLPKESGGGSPYERGGSLFALGLIFAGHGHGQVEYLQGQLRAAGNSLQAATAEVVQHGAALGLGLAAMGSQNTAVFDQLKELLYTDSAVAGEAAGIAMGLTMLGSGAEALLADMLQYARDTQHEKIIRGLGLGVALLALGTQSAADGLIDSLLADKDAILRMAGCHVIATAYAGTNENAVLRRLLHTAVSDVSDEVRRAAVTALGFLLFRTPEQVPSVVSLLCESFNPHVRHGACMAMAVACAASGSKEAISLLEPMAQDSSAIVRQGALVALALVLMQQPNSHPKVESARRLFQKVIADKHEDLLAKFGAIYAQGIMEAGGRNATIALSRDHGHMDVPAVVGLLLFSQFWFWFPLGHCLSLALRPSAIVCVTSDLKLPQLSLECAAPASAFAYPKATEAPKEKTREKVATAVLSTTSRVRAKAASKEKEKKEEEKESETPAPMAVDASPAAEAPTHTIPNPSRVLPDQLPKLSFASSARYQPVRKNLLRLGVVVVADTKPGDGDPKYVELSVALPAPTTAEAEAPPPEPFVFDVALEGE